MGGWNVAGGVLNKKLLKSRDTFISIDQPTADGIRKRDVVPPREYRSSAQPIVYAVNRSRDICHQSRPAAGATFPPMCSLNIDTSMRGCYSHVRERERGNFEVDRLHSGVLTNARLVAAAIASCGETGNRLIHATLSSQTNLVVCCLINLTPCDPDDPRR